MEDFAISLLAFANNFVDNLANFATPVANFAEKNGEYLKQPVAASDKKGLRDSNLASVFVRIKIRASLTNT